MNTINILLVIDTLATLASRNLHDNVYIVDTNGYIGSWGQGSKNLTTVAENSQLLSWSLKSINPANDLQLIGFSGSMVSEKICVPSKQGIAKAEHWVGAVAGTRIGLWAYNISVSIDDKAMVCSASIKVI